MRRIRGSSTLFPVGRLRDTCGAVVLLLAVPLPAAADAPLGPNGAAILAQQPPEVGRHLRERKIVLLPATGGDEYVEALVLFEQPLTVTLRLLSETARQIEFRPELTSIEPIRWSGASVIDEHRMRIMFKSIVYRLVTSIDFEAARIRWKLDPSFENSLRVLEGFWELYALDDGWTLGRFGTRIEVGPALPAFLQDIATRRNVPKSMENVRRWVNSVGTYRP